MKKIDIFAHVLLPNFYNKMLELDKDISKKYLFFNNPVLQDMKLRESYWDKETKQVISYVNANPEDYTNPEIAAKLCYEANEELLDCVGQYPHMFEGCVGMVPMNNIPEAIQIVLNQVIPNKNMHGIQLFTRHLGKSIANPVFEDLFKFLSMYNVPVWLHPVFDSRKPDNNIVFSWEYELSQAMMEIVQAGYFRKYPNLKIIVHHSGAMVPFFAGRIEHILTKEQAEDFKKFYVDTAILGNPKALELAVDYYGVSHVLFGTDSPLGILPAGATQKIIEAIEDMDITDSEKESIYWKNYHDFIGRN